MLVCQTLCKVFKIMSTHFVSIYVAIDDGDIEKCPLVMGVPCHRRLTAETGSGRLWRDHGQVLIKQPDKPKLVPIFTLLLCAYFNPLK